MRLISRSAAGMVTPGRMLAQVLLIGLGWPVLAWLVAVPGHYVALAVLFTHLTSVGEQMRVWFFD